MTKVGLKIVRLVLEEYKNGRGIFHLIENDLKNEGLPRDAENYRDKFLFYSEVLEKFSTELDQWEMYGEVHDPEVFIATAVEAPN